MKFQRFGNCFIGQRDDGVLYVLSYYMNTWHAYHSAVDELSPTEIGKYGYDSVNAARTAAIGHATRKPTSEEVHRAAVFKFVEELSTKSGVDIDPEGVWADLQSRMVKDT